MDKEVLAVRKLLLTGFDPFAHYQINPSWKVVQALPEQLGDFAITKLLLPNIYGLAGRMLLDNFSRNAFSSSGMILNNHSMFRLETS